MATTHCSSLGLQRKTTTSGEKTRTKRCAVWQGKKNVKLQTRQELEKKVAVIVEEVITIKEKSTSLQKNNTKGSYPKDKNPQIRGFVF